MHYMRKTSDRGRVRIKIITTGDVEQFNDLVVERSDVARVVPSIRDKLYVES